MEFPFLEKDFQFRIGQIDLTYLKLLKNKSLRPLIALKTRTPFAENLSAAIA